MPAIIVVGAQWGDEGKGKVVDLLTAKARPVVRAQGGHNAGHTIIFSALRKREVVVFEAAQGTFLAATLGTYPFVELKEVSSVF